MDHTLRRAFGSAVVDRTGGLQIAAWRVATPQGDVRVRTDDRGKRVRWLASITLTVVLAKDIKEDYALLRSINLLNSFSEGTGCVYWNDEGGSGSIVRTMEIRVRNRSEHALVRDLDRWTAEARECLLTLSQWCRLGLTPATSPLTR